MANGWRLNELIVVGLLVTLGAQSLAGPLDTWTKRIPSGVPNTGSLPAISAVAYGNGKFLAVGDMGLLNGFILTSLDGINWSGELMGYASLRSAIFANGMFVVLGGNFSGYDVIMTSADAITWATNTIVGAKGLRSIAYGNGRYVAVGELGAIYASSDTTNWTNCASVDNKVYLGVTYGASKFVVVGEALSGMNPQNGLILNSIDGTNFTTVAQPASVLLAVAYGNGMFVAGSNDKSIVLTSTNGSDWYVNNTGLTNAPPTLDAICYANGTFVAVSQSFGSSVLTSFDGIVWDQRSVVPNASLRGVGFGNGSFVAVGFNATILQSDDVGIPYFERFRRLTNGVLQMNISAEIGRSYQLQASTNLKAWDTLSTFTPVMAVSTLEDTTTNDVLRFYRVMSP